MILFGVPGDCFLKQIIRDLGRKDRNNLVINLIILNKVPYTKLFPKST